MASINTPKSQGEYLGKVVSSNANIITLDIKKPIVNGDGLSYLNRDANYDGVRVNKVIGNKLYLNRECGIKRGDVVYRTFDKTFNDILSKTSAKRAIYVDFTLWSNDKRLCLKAIDERGCAATHSVELDFVLEEAEQPQAARQCQILSKLGDTIFTMRNCQVLGHLFIPASLLAQLRRDTIALLERAHNCSYQRELRKPEDKTAMFPYSCLVSSDNVANHLAQQFYQEHGVTDIENALECHNVHIQTNKPVMTTRYCLRRELGACKIEKGCLVLPSPLFLRNGKNLLRLDCNCTRCEMTISIV